MNIEIVKIENPSKGLLDFLRGEQERKHNFSNNVNVAYAFKELYEAANCIQHWSDNHYNKETGKCEGMTVSAEHVRNLWEVLYKYKELYEDKIKAKSI